MEKGEGRSGKSEWEESVEERSKIGSGRRERLAVVSSCIWDSDLMRVNVSRKSRAAGPKEEGRHAVSKFRREVNMKIAIRDKKR